MKANDIRQNFIDYFTKQGHTLVPSSSLIPESDPTLLFANAGMNQFKNLFLGLEHRPYNRAVSVQKCVRAGGKHNDLENVGYTARHHTFFEMLGNFSFGDYFKKDAIHFAWDFLTNTLAIPKDKLYVTVFETDDEAAELWHKQEGVPSNRIFRLGEKDNFWRMGETGPCGPSSEIFFDHGPRAGSEADPYKGILSGQDRFVEIWNLVFMQFYEKAPGVMDPLPKPSVDTGAGLERVTAALQGKLNNYDTDLFWPIIVRSAEIAKRTDLLAVIEKMNQEGIHAKASEEDRKLIAALRVVADHTRSCAMLIADGVLPSNEGRGYVLRRILRRAVRFSQMLSGGDPFLPESAQTMIDTMSSAYPELKERRSVILSTLSEEQDRFMATLSSGTHILNDSLSKLKSAGRKQVPGEIIFKLYDTFGFPIDLTRLMAAESGFTLDETGFENEMNQARSKAKASWKGKGVSHNQAALISMAQASLDQSGPTKFIGYESLSSSAKVLLISNGKELVDELHQGETGIVTFDQTPFYAEGGGQAGDTGSIHAPGVVIQVFNTTKIQDIHLHHIQVESGTLSKRTSAVLSVDSSERRRTASNHSATHLLHAALRNALGTHVSQAGSLVDDKRLRFDFTHSKSVSSAELEQIENLVNEQISQALPVQTATMPPDEAIKKGALALFGEKYGDQVRVLSMGDFSTELCGGTHVGNTSQIRLFKILSESGVSSGVRRIEAVTGDLALEYLNKNLEENLDARKAAGISADVTLTEWINQRKLEIKDLEKQIRSLQGSKIDVDGLLANAKVFAAKGLNCKLVFADLAIEDREVLATLSDQIKNKLGSGISVIVGKGQTTHPIIVSVSKDLQPELNAGALLKLIAEKMGGKGGGRPDFAQGAAPKRENLKDALQTLEEKLK